MMVNYLYDLGKVAQNHERFATSGDIAASSEIRGLDAAARKQDLRRPAKDEVSG